MVHCRLVKMGLTAEVKGCVFSERHPVFRRPHVAFVFTGELGFFNRRHVQYSTSLPMCHCIRVKDGLPQLGYKKTPRWASIKENSYTASNFPSPSPSFWCIHVWARTCAAHKSMFYVHAMLAHPLHDFRLQVSHKAPLVTQPYLALQYSTRETQGRFRREAWCTSLPIFRGGRIFRNLEVMSRIRRPVALLLYFCF